MTREEAIRELMFAKREVIADSFIDKAYDMAISALKAQGTCEDAVSRQTLQKELALYPVDDVTSEDEAGYNRAINDIQKMVLHLPSAQPERLTDDDFETIRIHLNAYKEKLCNQQRWKEAEEYQRIIDRFMTFASAHPNLQPTCNLATDTISRQAAIDAILAVTGNSSVRELYEHVQEHGLSDMWSGGVSAAIDIIIAVPSAQPEPPEPEELDFVQPHKKIGVRLEIGQPEIIRCKDCKFYTPMNRETKTGICRLLMHQNFGDDWYCAGAERRTDD